MKINIHLDDIVLPIECGEGRQRLKWLATVSCIRYGLLQSECNAPRAPLEGGPRAHCCFVP